ncbi:MAG: HAMP domain-containing histidine kinase [Odoribacter sp.]|nr:HAMP domain-containing histidine kinase [Odoribacter sp.]
MKGKYKLLALIASKKDTNIISQIEEEGNYFLFFGTNEADMQELASEHKPDLFIISPENVNSELCKYIKLLRQKTSFSNTPVIFISPFTEELLSMECLNYKFIDFISKPLKTTELLFRIKKQIALMEAEKALKKQTQRLKQTIDSRDKLYSIIAHDLRAPIGTVKMINSYIEENKEKIRNADMRKKFAMINETTENAFNLLENLLRWTRNQSGKTKFIPLQFDVSIAVREVLSLFTSIAQAKNITLHNAVTKSLKVYADEDMVKTVLRNLISNAIKYTYPGGKVEVSFTENKMNIILAVKDNRKGMSIEQQKNLLKKNEALGSSGTKNEKGSGLGLLLCRDFIKINNGKLRFTSMEGKGTTFYFTLPKSE